MIDVLYDLQSGRGLLWNFWIEISDSIVEYRVPGYSNFWPNFRVLELASNWFEYSSLHFWLKIHFFIYFSRWFFCKLKKIIKMSWHPNLVNVKLTSKILFVLKHNLVRWIILQHRILKLILYYFILFYHSYLSSLLTSLSGTWQEQLSVASNCLYTK